MSPRGSKFFLHHDGRGHETVARYPHDYRPHKVPEFSSRGMGEVNQLKYVCKMLKQETMRSFLLENKLFFQDEQQLVAFLEDFPISLSGDLSPLVFHTNQIEPLADNVPVSEELIRICQKHENLIVYIIAAIDLEHNKTVLEAVTLVSMCAR